MIRLGRSTQDGGYRKSATQNATPIRTGNSVESMGSEPQLPSPDSPTLSAISALKLNDFFDAEFCPPTLPPNFDNLGLASPDRNIGAETVGAQPHDDLSDRGTLIHRRWSGADPAIFIDQQGLELQIGCWSPPQGLVGQVPYAIVVTLEVGVRSEIDVFTEVDVGIRTRGRSAYGLR